MKVPFTLVVRRGSKKPILPTFYVQISCLSMSSRFVHTHTWYVCVSRFRIEKYDLDFNNTFFRFQNQFKHFFFFKQQTIVVLKSSAQNTENYKAKYFAVTFSYSFFCHRQMSTTPITALYSNYSGALPLIINNFMF